VAVAVSIQIIMKKHIPGLVPINFKLAGKSMFLIGVISSAYWLVSYFTVQFTLSNNYIYLGIAMILISLYLIFVVPNEK